MIQNREKFILEMISLIMAAMWFLAAMHKILYPFQFYRSILDYRLIGGNPAVWLAFWFPFFEVFTGIGILIRRTRHESLMISAILLTGFLLLLIITVLRGMEIGCGCFSFSTEESLEMAIVRDLIFLTINSIAIICSFRLIKMEKPRQEHP